MGIYPSRSPNDSTFLTGMGMMSDFCEFLLVNMAMTIRTEQDHRDGFISNTFATEKMKIIWTSGHGEYPEKVDISKKKPRVF